MNITQESINKQWSEDAENYNRIIDDEVKSFRKAAWQTQILSNAPDKTPLNILDCGCGPGFFSTILAEKGHKVTAIDGSDKMLAYAIDRAAAAGLDIDFRMMDCHELAFDNNSFDLIVSRNVTHTFRDHKRVYEQWLRVLKPGGILLIFDANWHLIRKGASLFEEYMKCRAQCIAIYGDDFSGSTDPEEEEMQPSEDSLWEHTLRDKLRPDWDQGLLEGIGFSGIICDRDIIQDLWDDKEKLLYGLTPMFMIKCSKPCK